MINKLKEYWEGFIAILYPQSCLACEQPLVKGEDLVCSECIYQLPLTNYHLIKDNPTEQLYHGRIDLVFASSHFGFDKGGILQSLLHHLKYKDCPEVGILLGTHLGHGLQNSPYLPKVDYIIPVPIHKKRMRERGYNQSDAICEGIASILKAPLLNNNLQRINYTISQTKLNKENRWSNVANNFKVMKPELLENKHVLLVDDILTTGATLESCYQALSEVQDIRISIATLARAQ